MGINSKKLMVVLATVSLWAAACSNGGGSGGGAASAPLGPNISGVVSNGQSKVSAKSGEVSVMSGSAGCTTDAYDLTSGAKIATAKTAADGTFVLTGGGISAGGNYEVKANCPDGTKVSMVSTADTKQPSEKTAAVADPTSTYVAVQIKDAISKAVTSATAGLPASVADLVKAAVMKAVDSVIGQIKSTVAQAIAQGTIPKPTLIQAATLADVPANASSADIATANTAANVSVPPAIKQTIAGAAQAVAALPGCDSTVNGTLTTCTKAIAKLMYSALNFPVGLRITGGAFTIGAGNCNVATLGTDFPNASFTDGSAVQTAKAPFNYCVVRPLVGGVDRDRGPSDSGGDDHGPLFMETGDQKILTSDSALARTGAITAIAQGLFNHYKYKLSDIDKALFGYDSVNKAGLNGRIFAAKFNASAGQMAFSYLNSASAWTDFPTGCGGTGKPCAPSWAGSSGNTINWGFPAGSVLWTAAVDDAGTTGFNENTLATAISGGNNLTPSVFLAKFGGSVPTQAKLESDITSSRTHVDRNPSGQKEFFTLYTQQPMMTQGSNPCFDNDPSTPCLGADGTTQYPAMKVDVTVDTAATATGFHPIKALGTNNSTGAYYAIPYWGTNGFTGILNFVKAADGSRLADDFLQDRAVKIILDSTTECNANGLPTTGAGCANGKVYNVSVTWVCTGNCVPTYQLVAGTSVVDTTTTAFSVTIRANWNQKWTQFAGATPGSQFGAPLVYGGDYNNPSLLKFTLGTPAGSANDPFALASTFGQAGASEYNLAVHMSCSGTSCTLDGFYFVDNTGAPYNDTSPAAGGTMTVCGPNNCNYITPKYSAATINGYKGANSWPNAAATFTAAASRSEVDNGPVPNPNWKCDQEPFFVDGNGNGVLDCDPNTGLPTGGDVSFAGQWDFNSWQHSPGLTTAQQTARNTAILVPRTNGYTYGNPVAALKLLNIAFAGWFDGSHTLDASTQVNALQHFGLVYMFFSESGNFRHLDISGAPSSEFDVDMPMMMGNGGGGDAAFNHYYGNALLNVHQ